MLPSSESKSNAVSIIVCRREEGATVEGFVSVGAWLVFCSTTFSTFFNSMDVICVPVVDDEELMDGKISLLAFCDESAADGAL